MLAIEAIERGEEGILRKVKAHPKVTAIVELLKRRDLAANAPKPPAGSADNPLHVGLTLTQRLAKLESAFLGAATRAGESPVPVDDRNKRLAARVTPAPHQAAETAGELTSELGRPASPLCNRMAVPLAEHAANAEIA